MPNDYFLTASIQRRWSGTAVKRFSGSLQATHRFSGSLVGRHWTALVIRKWYATFGRS